MPSSSFDLARSIFKPYTCQTSSASLSDMHTNLLTSGYKSLLTPPYRDLAVICTLPSCAARPWASCVYTSHITNTYTCCTNIFCPSPYLSHSLSLLLLLPCSSLIPSLHPSLPPSLVVNNVGMSYEHPQYFLEVTPEVSCTGSLELLKSG